MHAEEPSRDPSSVCACVGRVEGAHRGALARLASVVTSFLMHAEEPSRDPSSVCAVRVCVCGGGSVHALPVRGEEAGLRPASVNHEEGGRPQVHLRLGLRQVSVLADPVQLQRHDIVHGIGEAKAAARAPHAVAELAARGPG
eukprot:105750-Chlamydomonas_euryale.AAC.1